MKTPQKTDEEMNEIMKEVIKEGFFNQSQNLLGVDIMKKHGLTKDNLNIKKILEVMNKERKI